MRRNIWKLYKKNRKSLPGYLLVNCILNNWITASRSWERLDLTLVTKVASGVWSTYRYTLYHADMCFAEIASEIAGQEVMAG